MLPPTLSDMRQTTWRTVQAAWRILTAEPPGVYGDPSSTGTSPSVLASRAADPPVDDPDAPDSVDPTPPFGAPRAPAVEPEYHPIVPFYPPSRSIRRRAVMIPTLPGEPAG